MRLVVVSTFALLCVGDAAAHHGWSTHYDRDTYMTLTGVITEFQFVNPHAFVYLETVNDAGESEARWCEMQSRVQLERRGIGTEHFAVGARIDIEGFASKRDPEGCELAIARFQDGTELVLRYRDGEAVYGARVAEGNTSIVGTWYPHSYLVDAGSGADSSRSALTPRGEAVHAAFDWVTQNPTLSCSPASNIRAWSAPGLPTRISRRGNAIHIQHEFMDAHRIVYLDRAGHPEEVPPTDLGHSIGRFEDGALYIETARFRAGALWAGRLNTADLVTTEKLWVDPEGLLQLEWSATDPAYYTGTQRGTRTFIRTDLELGRFDCQPEIGHAPTG